MFRDGLSVRNDALGALPVVHNSAKRPLCLITEIHGVIGMDLEQAAEAVGFEPVLAYTDHEALDLLNRCEPDVAVIDVALAWKGRGELATDLKRRRIPFVIHTAHNPPDRLGPDLADIRWFAKPADVPTLFTHLRGLVGSELVAKQIRAG